MIRKVSHKNPISGGVNKQEELLLSFSNDGLESFRKSAMDHYKSYTIEFYEVIAVLLGGLGFNNVQLSRDGDTNNRMDALIVDEIESIPIEIKSPMETEFINVKSIRQALENKIILLSRKFYPTKAETSSLAIGYKYPQDRSTVTQLIDDFYTTYGFCIGIIDFETLLKLYYNVVKDEMEFDLSTIHSLKGVYA